MKGRFASLAQRGENAGHGNQPTETHSAADEKPPRDRHSFELRSIWTVRGLLLAQIAIFLVLVLIHFGLVTGGYRRLAAAATESVIVAVLAFGLLLTWTPPPWSQCAATAAQAIGSLGVLVGLVTIAVGIAPRSTLDLGINVVLLVTLIAGLAVTKKIGRRHSPPHP